MWLDDVLSKMSLTCDVEEYLLGRGSKDSTISDEGMVTWCSSNLDSDIPDGSWVYGKRGEKLDGQLICPVRSPKGITIGFEARNIHKKAIQDFRLPESKWTPFFIGTRAAMPKIWSGGDVWVVEGLFDKTAIEWAVRDSDAVLATVTARLSDLHVEFMRRFCTGWVNMVYDNDETGRRATIGWVDRETGKKRSGALDLLKRAGVKCRDVPYHGGKDPGVIWDHGGVAAIKAAFPMQRGV